MHLSPTLLNVLSRLPFAKKEEFAYPSLPIFLSSNRSHRGFHLWICSRVKSWKPSDLAVIRNKTKESIAKKHNFARSILMTDLGSKNDRSGYRVEMNFRHFRTIRETPIFPLSPRSVLQIYHLTPLSLTYEGAISKGKKKEKKIVRQFQEKSTLF